jgi:hypothetical protein
MNNDLAVYVARLAGYLGGLAAIDGDIRQFTATAFVVSGKNSSDSPETMIADFYAAQANIQFSGSQKLERGLGDLERQLNAYVVRRPWGLGEQMQRSVDDRRRYLAFRIMDMITDIAPEARNLRSVYKLESKSSGADSDVTFFCVRIESGFLVLQFNDDSPFIRAQISR